MIRPPNDDEFGSFGEAAKSLLDSLFPEAYKTIVVIDPSFDIKGMPNIAPQFRRGDFFAVSSVEVRQGTGQFRSDVTHFSSSQDAENLLEFYRPTHTIFASSDLGVMTAWAQGEYAVVAVKFGLVAEYEEWFEEMHAMDVLRDIP